MRLNKLLFFQVLLVFFLTHPVWTAASAKTFQSNPSQVSLLELYTSEGCSSCPPADAWLSSLKNNRALWEEFVPVAFHVQYWDYIGWKDRLGSAEFATRQKRYTIAGSLSGVYTPGIVLNGREWRRWQHSRKISASSELEVGVLQIEALDQDQYEVTFFPENQTITKWLANIALLGFDIESHVKAGENSGRLLKHDFAVVRYEDQAMKEEKGAYRAVFTLNPEGDVKSARYGIAAWVHVQDEVTPIQAVGGYL